MNDKILIQFNKVEADKKINILGIVKTQLQAVCDEFTALNPAFSISIDEVSTLFAEVTNPQSSILRPNIEQIKSLILNRLLPGGKLNGLPVNIEKYEELFLLPNTDNLLNKIRNTHAHAIEFLRANYYALDKAGKILIAPGAEDQINESFKIYCETDEEIERLEKAKVLVSAINGICNLAKNELDFIGDLEMVVDWDETSQFIVNPDFVKNGVVGQYQRMHQFLHLDSPKPAPELAPIPEAGFSNEFLKQMGIDNKPDPEPDYSPDYFNTK